MCFLGLELVVTLKTAELLWFQWKSLDPLWGFMLMKASTAACAAAQLLEQSLGEYIHPETRVFQNQSLIHASPLNMIWDQTLNSAEKILHSSNFHPVKRQQTLNKAKNKQKTNPTV